MNNISDFLAWWFEKPRLSDKNQAMLEAYYANYYRNFNGYLKEAFADRHAELEQAITGGVGRFLDIGCGTGTVVLYVEQKSPDMAIGIDVKDDRLDCARERGTVLRSDCVLLDINLLRFDPAIQLDTIYLEETLHHLEPRQEAIEKIVSLLAPGGRLIISEVNALNPLMQIKLLRQRGLRTITHYEGQLYGNERVLTARHAIEMFKDLHLESLRYFRIFPSTWGNMQVEKRLLRLPFPQLFAVHYNLVMTKEKK